jgi:hypothetical protein
MFGTALVAAIAVLIKYLNELTTLFGNSNKDEQTFKDLLMLATVFRDVKILSKQGMQLMGASSSSNTISSSSSSHISDFANTRASSSSSSHISDVANTGASNVTAATPPPSSAAAAATLDCRRRSTSGKNIQNPTAEIQAAVHGFQITGFLVA